ncbi:hypothetical protein VD0004_g2742 [Verticillium dahliae]|uniref:GPI anchored protein n=1 Tax=Verticillium dahliae TaxID=27337 RepID=A0A444S4U3_VERDA|nr:hypothetical protein VD0004_g2742 [Verticillium dahliae]PNH76378.1 hypothetical protein VD0001_g1198 [Verticillium dahliae]RXG48364.1 hypothetical protein VDGE_07662 [Verticillium dahliae]
MRSSAVLFLAAAGLVAAQETVDTTTVTVSAETATVTASESETTLTWEVDTTTIWSGTETETVWVQPGGDDATETETETEATATETETVTVPVVVVPSVPSGEDGETATSTWYEESSTITLVPVETTSFVIVYNDISSATTVTTTLYTPAPNATASGIETVPTAGAGRIGASGAALVAFGAAGLALL